MRPGNSIPANRTASIVVSNGYDYHPAKKVDCFHSPICPPVVSINSTTRKAQGFIDLTGSKVGRFTVVGLSYRKKRRWVVKCSCGMFEMRKAKALKNKENYGDRCQICRHTSYLMRKDEYRQHGDNRTDQRDF